MAGSGRHLATEAFHYFFCPVRGPGSDMTDTLDYQTMTHNAMMSIVRDALESVAESGLPGEHHFYVTFAPQHPSVDMSDDLRARQGDEMTIVLQHQFENLIVSERGFQVDLAFDGVVQTLRIPFSTILAFFDPSVEFGLRFPANQEQMLDAAPPATAAPDTQARDDADASAPEAPKTGEVVNLDTFRDK
tara:strand:- start:243 stop:809 length:567 start_codon:yes stop_codon:yes gene_type:complete